MLSTVELEKRSGRMILDHFDLLKEIYRDSPLKVPIPSRPNTSSVNEELVRMQQSRAT